MHQPAGPNNLAWFDSALGALKHTGVPEEAKVGIVMGLITYVQGEIRVAFDLAAGYEANPAAFQQFGTTLARVVDPLVYPAVFCLVGAGVFDEVGSSRRSAASRRTTRPTSISASISALTAWRRSSTGSVSPAERSRRRTGRSPR